MEIENKTGTENPDIANQTDDDKDSKPKANEQTASKTQKKKKPNEWEVKYTELNDQYLRALAEYDNFRKRTLKEKKGMYTDGILAAAAALIPVLDNLQRAIISAEDKDSALCQGVQMVVGQFEQALSSLEISEIDPQGKTFDPNLHSAATHITDEQYGDNEVIEVLQKGYRHKDGNLIRPAMVAVAN